MILNNGRLKVVVIGGTLREGSTAGGDLAGVIAVAAMAHALRGTVAPLTVAIPQVWKRADGDGDVTDEGYGERLDKLGRHERMANSTAADRLDRPSGRKTSATFSPVAPRM